MKIPAFYIQLGFSVALASDLATNIKMVAIAAVVGPVLLVFRKLTPEMGSLMKVFDPLFKILGRPKNATGALSITFRALSGQVSMIAAVIAG